ncbi:MAG: sugar transporter [Pseudomonadota bacterium]
MAAPRAMPPPMPAPVPPAGPRRLLALSFVGLVLVPLVATAIYLFWFAAPQYASHAGFSVRQEEAPAQTGLFGGMGGAGASDADILYAYLTSQELVRAVDADVDLRAAFARAGPRDPIFGFHAGGTIEDLVTYWGRMVRVSHDAATGLIEMRVRAFAPEDAQAIAQSAVRHGGALIVELSAIARDDTLRYAREDVEDAWTRLSEARQAMTAFRARTQVVDPTADVSGQMGLLGTLEAQLAEELIRVDVLTQNSTPEDPRIAAARQRIDVIKARIADERSNLGGGRDGADYATVIDEYERLSADVMFGSETYAAARAALDTARAEARRQTRYLAEHIRPTLAERATAPDPLIVLGVFGLFLTLIWGMGALIVASLRDRQ